MKCRVLEGTHCKAKKFAKGAQKSRCGAQNGEWGETKRLERYKQKTISSELRSVWGVRFIYMTQPKKIAKGAQKSRCGAQNGEWGETKGFKRHKHKTISSELRFDRGVRFIYMTQPKKNRSQIFKFTGRLAKTSPPKI